jgi:hypothetical protein
MNLLIFIIFNSILILINEYFFPIRKIIKKIIKLIDNFYLKRSSI